MTGLNKLTNCSHSISRKLILNTHLIKMIRSHSYICLLPFKKKKKKNSKS